MYIKNDRRRLFKEMCLHPNLKKKKKKLTCTGANTHDGIKSNALLYFFPQVSQKMLTIRLHLTSRFL